VSDAHPHSEAFRQLGLDRATGAIRSGLAKGFHPRTNLAPQLAGVTLTPIGQGGFGIGLEPLVQAIDGGTPSHGGG
jgi:hypothetical protein